MILVLILESRMDAMCTLIKKKKKKDDDTTTTNTSSITITTNTTNRSTRCVQMSLLFPPPFFFPGHFILIACKDVTIHDRCFGGGVDQGPPQLQARIFNYI